MTFSDLELEEARDVLWSEVDRGSPEFAEALSLIKSAIEEGKLEYAGLVAEICALDGPFHDPALAYTLYHVALALEGYGTVWANESTDPAHYVGPVGDFRNEGLPNDMLQLVGFAAAQGLDSRARKLLSHEA